MSAKEAGADVPEEIPVKYSFDGSLRRSALGFPPKLEQLRNKLAKSFPEHANQFLDLGLELRLIYTDDEGDEITIATNDELLTAFRLAQQAGKVLRFTVPEPKPVAPKPAAVPLEKVEEEVTAAIAELAVRDPDAEVAKAGAAQTPADTATTTSEKVETPPVKPVAVFPDPNKTPEIPMLEKVVGALISGVPVHFGFICALSQEMIIGQRFTHKLPPHHSINEGAYYGLNAKEREVYQKCDLVYTNCTISDPIIAKAKEWNVPIHTGVRCAITGMTPIIGTRYRHRFHGMTNMCQFAFNTITRQNANLKHVFLPCDVGQDGAPQVSSSNQQSWRTPCSAKPPQHDGVSCDDCLMDPIIGLRWHKRGCNFDLCQRDYMKLSPAQQAQFECIVNPQNPQPQCQRGFRDFRFGRRGFGRPFQNKKMRGKQRTGASAKFLKDLTVADNTRKAPGQRFEKAWLMSAGRTGVPEGCYLMFIGGDHMNAKNLRIPVENTPLNPGSTFELRIPFQAPQKPGHYRSFWRLITAEGRRFGPRLWADILVAEPAVTADGASKSESEASEAALDAVDCKRAPVAEKAAISAIEQSQWNMQLSADLTIAQGTVVPANTMLRKTWLVATTTGWGPNCVLKCVEDSGTQPSKFVGLEERVPAVPVNAQAEISITLQSPADPGHYSTRWFLMDPDGCRVGELDVDFFVR